MEAVQIDDFGFIFECNIYEAVQRLRSGVGSQSPSLFSCIYTIFQFLFSIRISSGADPDRLD